MVAEEVSTGDRVSGSSGIGSAETKEIKLWRYDSHTGATCETKCFRNIFPLKIRICLKNLLGFHSLNDHIHHGSGWDSEVAYARYASHALRINRYPGKLHVCLCSDSRFSR